MTRAGSTSEEGTRFVPSKKTRARVWPLLSRAKSGDLSVEERTDLDHYLELEHIMHLAKAKARKLAPHSAALKLINPQA
jgi:hypothetical protein